MIEKYAYGYPAELIGEIIYKNIPIRYEGYIDEYSKQLNFNIYVGQAVVSGLTPIGDFHDSYGRMPGFIFDDVYRKLHEDVVRKTAKKHDINLPNYFDTMAEYFFTKDEKLVGPGFTSDEHMFTAVCKECGEENPYKYYDPDYVCKKCQMMADWAKSAVNKTKILYKLANLYFLKSLAMDETQARQILGLLPNASKNDIMFAYKKQMHKLYMQTGQYQKIPMLDEARDSLMQEPSKSVEIVQENEPEKTDIPKQNDKTDYDLLKDLRSNLECYVPNYKFEIQGYDLRHQTSSISEAIETIDRVINDLSATWVYIFAYNNDSDILIGTLKCNEDTSKWTVNFGAWSNHPNMTWDEFKPILSAI